MLDFNVTNFAGDFRRTFHVAEGVSHTFRITHATRWIWTVEVSEFGDEWMLLLKADTLREAKEMTQAHENSIAA